jgi:hypothetical protein
MFPLVALPWKQQQPAGSTLEASERADGFGLRDGQPFGKFSGGGGPHAGVECVIFQWES